MRDADVAMYRAKADGKGRHAVFDAEMHEQVDAPAQPGDTNFAAPIESGSLEVGYQPIVQAATGRIVGFEALGRWPHRRAGGSPGRWPRRRGWPSRSAARC